MTETDAKDVYSKRFEDLSYAAQWQLHQPWAGDIHVSMVADLDYDATYTLAGNWLGWATKCQALLKSVFGNDSPHYFNFTGALTSILEKRHDHLMLEAMANQLVWLFDSAKDDFDRGYVAADLRGAISGEVLGDFIQLAKRALEDGYKDVAAVLAAAALEDALKRYAESSDLDVEGKEMSQVINAIKSKGLLAGNQNKVLRAMPKIRNDAMHADWENVSDASVNSMIGFTETFLLRNFP